MLILLILFVIMLHKNTKIRRLFKLSSSPIFLSTDFQILVMICRNNNTMVAQVWHCHNILNDCRLVVQPPAPLYDLWWMQWLEKGIWWLLSLFSRGEIWLQHCFYSLIGTNRLKLACFCLLLKIKCFFHQKKSFFSCHVKQHNAYILNWLVLLSLVGKFY